MAASIQVTLDRPQPDGTRMATYELNLDGELFRVGPHHVPAGMTAEARGVDLLARWEPRHRASEIDKIERLIMSDKLTPATMSPKLNKAADVNAELAKRMFRAVRDKSDDERMEKVRKLRPVLDELGDAESAKAIGMTRTQLTAAKAKLDTLVTGMTEAEKV